MSKCKFCNRDDFKTSHSLNSHQTRCKSNPDYKYYNTITQEIKDKLSTKFKNKAKQEYNSKPCKLCGAPIPYELKTRKYCSDKCTKLSRNIRRKHSLETRSKISSSLRQIYHFKTDLKNQYKENKGHYSRIFYSSCDHCGKQFIGQTYKKYCTDHRELYSSRGRNEFVFTFNVYHYPEMFDISFINEHGWRDSKTNPNGVTRDHKISVNDAIRNNYDPFYIKHPMNCELMLFDQNNKKNTKSSMSYEILVHLVDEYEKNI